MQIYWLSHYTISKRKEFYDYLLDLTKMVCMCVNPAIASKLFKMDEEVKTVSIPVDSFIEDVKNKFGIDLSAHKDKLN